MASIVVFDIKLQKWMPYVPDYDKWYQQFIDLSEEYSQPDHTGRYIVDSGSRNRIWKKWKLSNGKKRKRNSGTAKKKNVVKLVSPVAQALEMARSEIKRERKENSNYKSGSGQCNKYHKQSSIDWNSWTANNWRKFPEYTRSRYVRQIKLKYRKDDLSLPVQTPAEDEENNGWHFTFRSVVLTNFVTTSETD